MAYGQSTGNNPQKKESGGNMGIASSIVGGLLSSDSSSSSGGDGGGLIGGLVNSIAGSNGIISNFGATNEIADTLKNRSSRPARMRQLKGSVSDQITERELVDLQMKEQMRRDAWMRRLRNYIGKTGTDSKLTSQDLLYGSPDQDAEKMWQEFSTRRQAESDAAAKEAERSEKRSNAVSIIGGTFNPLGSY